MMTRIFSKRSQIMNLSKNKGKPITRRNRLLAETLEILESRDNPVTIPTSFTPGALEVAFIAYNSSSTAAAPVTIEELSTTTTANSTANTFDGYQVQLNSTPSAGNNALTLEESNGSNNKYEGLMQTSEDGRYLSLSGYNQAAGTAGVDGLAGGRTLGLINSLGVADLTTTDSMESGDQTDSAVTADGTGFYDWAYVGENVAVDYVPLSGGTGVPLQNANSPSVSTGAETTLNAYLGVEIADNQIFGSADSSPYLEQTGDIGNLGTVPLASETGPQILPTPSGTQSPGLTNFALPSAAEFSDGSSGHFPYVWSWVSMKTNPNIKTQGPDTIFAADRYNGLEEFSFDGTDWNRVYATTSGLPSGQGRCS